MKKIAIFFDGTWNSPNDSGDIEQGANTNVYKLQQAIAEQDRNGAPQITHYVAGVGTRWYNRVRGGVFGVGLDRNIKDGYSRLVDLYEDGDAIYVLGFSRGAYSARSLVGMIRNVGLVRKQANRRSQNQTINRAYELYRTRDEGADSPSAKVFREEFSRESRIQVHFLGVWDTVGALGVPLRSFGWFNARRYEFHDTELSGIVDNAFHAIAVDEHRSNYEPTLWAPKNKPNQRLEQVWFSGAHADVGGGYQDARLADIALHWMAARLRECDLDVDPNKLPAVGPDNVMAPLHDSFARFLKGAYQRVSSRVYRPLGTQRYGNETLDGSVRERLERCEDYRPGNIVQSHLRVEGADLGEIARLKNLRSMPAVS